VIALIDYGAGNLTSVRKGFAAVQAALFTPASPGELTKASSIVVPGVGHFGATAALDAAWRTAILDAVRGGLPLLGICLGMQWLYDGSAEAPEVPGLGAVSGRCDRIPSNDSAGIKVPHVGWNSLAVTRTSRLMAGVPDGTQVYFTHSFAAPITDACVAVCTHGQTFAAVVEAGNVFGVQFHPEKSSAAGLRMLANFAAASR
jgi:glutamine amidotransferase